MNQLGALLFGALAGCGGLVCRFAVRGGKFSWSPSTLLRSDHRSLQAVGVGLSAGLTLLLLTGWPIAALAAGALGALGILLSGSQSSSRRDEQIAEAVALWAEQLRDTLAAAHGLQQTIVATAPHAPELLAPSVARLAADLPYGSMSTSLHTFAQEVAHPSADFVVAALIAATEHEARDVGSLLGHLAACAREEAKMHQRVWVSRARTRTAVRIIVTTVVGFVGALFLLNREYLEPYGTTEGQTILSGILGVFAAALVLLQNGSRVPLPDRFVASRSTTTATGQL